MRVLLIEDDPTVMLGAVQAFQLADIPVAQATTVEAARTATVETVSFIKDICHSIWDAKGRMPLVWTRSTHLGPSFCDSSVTAS